MPQIEHQNKRIRVAISQGDINGISYEILLKTFEDERILELFTPIVYGSSQVLNYWTNLLGQSTKHWHKISSLNELKDDRVNLFEVTKEEVSINLGEPTNTAGNLALLSLELATQAVLEGKADFLVTAPINKSTMPKDRFPFAGHTQYLESVAAVEPNQSLMLLASGDCRVALITDHIPISQVATTITKDRIIEKVKILEKGLIQDFGIIKPRIALLGLNPHAGDRGLIGKEEQSIITPAIEELSQQGHIVFGPYPADGFWANGHYDSFDGVVAMYHDQGLAPFKSLYMSEGVNITLGLSIVRTSPDHGTGYDIAGKNVALPDSFRNAIYTGIDIVRARKNYEWANRNPLRRVYFNKGRDDEKLDFSSDDNY